MLQKAFRGRGWDERPIERTVLRRRLLALRRPAHPVVLKALAIGLFQRPGDGARRVDGHAVFPVMAVLGHDVAGHLTKPGLAIGISGDLRSCTDMGLSLRVREMPMQWTASLFGCKLAPTRLF